MASRLPRLLISSKLLLCPIVFTSTASFPSQGWTPASPARLSLSSVDETTETKCSSSVGDEHQWMVSWEHSRHRIRERLEAALEAVSVHQQSEMVRWDFLPCLLKKNEKFSFCTSNFRAKQTTQNIRTHITVKFSGWQLTGMEMAHAPIL